MWIDPLPLTYDECRARFRRSVETAGLDLDARPIAARGPFGQELTVDATRLGASTPDRALVVLSGVHGVEGFIGSALQCDLVSRITPDAVSPGVAVVLVHIVNPWGMAHDRRQNESNVDLNRNWRRSDIDPVDNDPYDEIHTLACPDTPVLPQVEDLFAQAADLVERRGSDWVRAAITSGQYRHPDGLHYGGTRTEASNLILEALLPEMVGEAERVLVVDLHTGHGPHGEVTLLSAAAVGTDEDAFLRAIFGSVDAPDEAGAKRGRIAPGVADLLPNATSHAVTLEFGTADDGAQLAATYQEQWVHRHGDPAHPAHRAAKWRYRSCFTPTDAEWEARSFDLGRRHLDLALDAVVAWV